MEAGAAMKSFSLSDFRALGVCRSGLVRVAAFGGAVAWW